MFDAIVIGLGAMGSATLWELARRGLHVLGIEQFDVPHALGSSHGQSRLIRMAYYEHPDYVPLLRRAYQRWRLLEQEEAVRVLEITGGLYIGPAGCELVAGSLHSARTHALAHEHLTGAAIERRWPVFQNLAGMEGVYENEAGFLRPEAAIAAFATGALRRGAAIHAQERVLDWQPHPAGFALRTDRAHYTTHRLIVTAGPWSAALLDTLRDNIRVTRQVMGWFWPRQPERFAVGAFPVWCLQPAPDQGLIYGPPMPALPGANWEGGPIGLKVAHHLPGAPAAPDTVDRHPQTGDFDLLRNTLRRHLPAADGPPTGMRVCLYSNSPDHHFLIDRTPEGITFAAGFSGHGFKFASAIGEALADLAIDGKTALPMEFLRLQRLPK